MTNHYTENQNAHFTYIIYNKLYNLQSREILNKQANYISHFLRIIFFVTIASYVYTYKHNIMQLIFNMEFIALKNT